jgi:hypothetical protein
MPRRINQADLTGQIEWLRAAAGDPQLNARLVLGGILDLLSAIVELIPPPKGPPQ